MRARRVLARRQSLWRWRRSVRTGFSTSRSIVSPGDFAIAVVLGHRRLSDIAADLHLHVAVARVDRLQALGRRFLREHRRRVELADRLLHEVDTPPGQHGAYIDAAG